jgi:hypothetical protein
VRLILAVLCCLALATPARALTPSKLGFAVRLEHRWTDENRPDVSLIRQDCKVVSVIGSRRDVRGSLFADFILNYPLPFRGLGVYARAGHAFETDVDEAGLGLTFRYGGIEPRHPPAWRGD